MKTAGALLLSLILCFAVAGLGGFFTSSGIGSGWYATLRKPEWNPPAWVFGPVWTALYVMMALAAWLVWRTASPEDSRWPLGLYAAQLVLNACWSFCFFYLRNPLAGLVELLVLWACILATMLLFWRVTPMAGWLFVPYLAWVSFAGFLNGTLWWLNRGA